MDQIKIKKIKIQTSDAVSLAIQANENGNDMDELYYYQLAVENFPKNSIEEDINRYNRLVFHLNRCISRMERKIERDLYELEDT